MNDVIIIGGGPAGAGMGAYLSLVGIDNVIIESANHPRPHVGESMVPSSTRVFDEIGFLPVMEQEGFVKKYGASWHPISTKGEFDIEFSEFRQEGISQDHTYHVDRGRFDHLLLKHAEKLGSKVYQGAPVKEVVFRDGKACGVRVEVSGKSVELPCKVVVDASGRRTVLGSQLRLKRKDPIFNQFAVHAWFENVNKGSSPTSDYIHVYFLPVERGWVWQIPITEKITSVGVVAEREVFRQSKKDVEGWFDTYINSTPALADAMQDARRINDFKTEGDYSYKMDRFVGDGFVLVGDAARFVDPIFSSGVSVALYSARFASERIRYGLETGNLGESVFKPYEDRLRAGTDIWYEFITLYYKLLPIFTYFIENKEYRMQVHQLLQGDVYDRKEAPVLKKMRDFVKTVEKAESHIFKNQLTSIHIA